MFIEGLPITVFYSGKNGAWMKHGCLLILYDVFALQNFQPIDIQYWLMWWYPWYLIGYFIQHFRRTCRRKIWILTSNKSFRAKMHIRGYRITATVWCLELCFLCTALLLEIYLPMKFQVSSLTTFLVKLRTKFKHENEQMAITPKVWSFELWFLCTALLLSEIFLPMKFHVDALKLSSDIIKCVVWVRVRVCTK